MDRSYRVVSWLRASSAFFRLSDCADDGRAEALEPTAAGEIRLRAATALVRSFAKDP